MAVELTADERAIASGASGEGAAMAMRIVAETARLMGAGRLIPIESAHIDGALYHGDSGTLFAERLVAGGAKTSVRATLNVGAIDLTGCSRNRLPPHEREMAQRVRAAGARRTATAYERRARTALRNVTALRALIAADGPPRVPSGSG